MWPRPQPLRIASGDLTLEAELLQPEGIAPRGLLVVCHPHPQYGGSMENNVVYALCEAAAQEGLAALRFNFRGVGASEGAYDGGRGEREDVRAALAAAAALPGGHRLALAGYSFGAAMAVRAGCAGEPRLEALVLVSPPLQTLGASEIARCSMARFLIAGDADRVCPAETLEAIALRLQPPASYRIVEGAEHSWLGYESELRDAAGAFLRWQLT